MNSCRLAKVVGGWVGHLPEKPCKLTSCLLQTKLININCDLLSYLWALLARQQSSRY